MIRSLAAVLGIWMLGLYVVSAASAQRDEAQGGEAVARQMAHAGALLEAGRTDEAEAILSRILEEKPGHGPALVQLGRVALERGDATAARDLLSAAVTGPLPRPYLAWHLLARAESLLGRPGEAAQAWERAGGLAAAALARQPDLVPALRVVIAAAESRGDHWAVLEGTAALLDYLPAAPVVLAGAAQAALALGAAKEARCLVTRALEEAPDDLALVQLLGSVELEALDPVAAAVSLRRARELGAAGAQFELLLGRAEFESMATDAAIAAYRRALSEEPSAIVQIPPLALSSLVESLVEEDRAGLSALLEQVLAADAENPSALLGVALAAVRAGDLTTARRNFELLERLAPGDSRAQYHLGQFYIRQGEVELGRAAMERFSRLKAEEDTQWERHNEAFRRRIEAEAVAAADPRSALEIYGELAADGFANADDFLAAGRALMALEDFASAAAWFDKVLQNGPYNEQAMVGLAQAARQAGRPNDAAPTQRRLDLMVALCRRDPP